MGSENGWGGGSGGEKMETTVLEQQFLKKWKKRLDGIFILLYIFTKSDFFSKVINRTNYNIAFIAQNDY